MQLLVVHVGGVAVVWVEIRLWSVMTLGAEGSVASVLCSWGTVLRYQITLIVIQAERRTCLL